MSELQPRVSARVTVKASLEEEVWRVQANVSRGNVVVPETRGNKLHASGTPAGMVIIENGRPPPAVAEPKSRFSVVIGARPSRARLVAEVNLETVSVTTRELRGGVRGRLTATLGDDALAIDGGLSATRGDLDLFDRRFRVDRASVRFDGSTDPQLDIRLVHDYPQLTLFADVRGRLSTPELHLTSEPGTYSEGQLLSFLLGGAPGAEPGSEIRDAATGVASTLLSQKIGGYVEKFLPINLDVMRFEAATANSSAAFTLGKWLTRKLFVAYRRRLESRPDENAGEAELEYWLGRNVLFEGSVGDRGISGADLLWLRRW